MSGTSAVSSRWQGYPSYKPSGVAWLGEVPEHWQVAPPKRALHSPATGTVPIKNQASSEPRECYVPAFSASGQDVWLPEAAFTEQGLVLSAVGARCGKTFRAEGEWGVTANTHVLLPRSGQCRDYWWYISNEETWWERAGTAQPFVQVSKTLGRPWVLPPLPEQQAIADFLDRETAKIDALVGRMERLIQLLQEKRTALISHAVTKGLDPNAPMKDSGVEWLGEVPEHWSAAPLKRVVSRPQTGTTPPTAREAYYTDGSVPWYGPGSLGIGVAVGAPSKLISAAAVTDGMARLFAAGSTLVCTIGSIGKAAQLLTPGCANQQITCLTPLPGALKPRYLAYTMKRMEPVLCGIAPSTTLPIVDLQELCALDSAVPPLPEQQAIADHLDAETARIDALVAKAHEGIERLKEYRTALISAAVTGKIDVRDEV